MLIIGTSASRLVEKLVSTNVGASVASIAMVALAWSSYISIEIVVSGTMAMWFAVALIAVVGTLSVDVGAFAIGSVGTHPMAMVLVRLTIALIVSFVGTLVIAAMRFGGEVHGKPDRCMSWEDLS